MPFLTGQDSDRPHEELFWRSKRRTAIRVGDWKLVRNPGRGSDGEWELYNLAEDLGETNNLWLKHPDIVEELTKVLAGAGAE